MGSIKENPLIAPWPCVSSNNTGMVLCLLRSGIPYCSVRRLEDPALIDNNLPVSWLFSLGTNVKSPRYSYNMCFIGCLR